MSLSATTSMRKLLLLLLVSLLAVALGTWMLRDPGEDPVMAFIGGWLTIVFFGLGIIAVLVQIALPKPRLTIDSYGVTWTRRSDQAIPWSTIADLDILRIGRSQRYLVLWLTDPDRFPPRRQPRRSGPSWATRTYGGDVHIPLSSLTVSWKTVWEAAQSHAHCP